MLPLEFGMDSRVCQAIVRCVTLGASGIAMGWNVEECEFVWPTGLRG